MSESLWFDDPLVVLQRGRGRPSREESDELARQAQFFAGKPVTGIATQSATTIKLEPKRFHWWYEGIIDWMIANPDKELADCAKAMNCSNQHIYQLTQSDIFNERYRERVNQKNELLNTHLVQKVAAAAITATALIQDKLSADAAKPVEHRKITLESLSDVNDRLLKSLGYGGKAAAPPVTVNVNQQIETGADPALLRSSAAKIVNMVPAEGRDERQNSEGSDERHIEPEITQKEKELIDELEQFFAEPELVAGSELDPELAERADG